MDISICKEGCNNMRCGIAVKSRMLLKTCNGYSHQPWWDELYHKCITLAVLSQWYICCTDESCHKTKFNLEKGFLVSDQTIAGSSPIRWLWWPWDVKTLAQTVCHISIFTFYSFLPSGFQHWHPQPFLVLCTVWICSCSRAIHLMSCSQDTLSLSTYTVHLCLNGKESSPDFCTSLQF